ncbi:MAG: ABC transporter ATP-binding protein [Gammaproteobacteria bacterium]|jgi:putrescine transport system ATP-binding protein|nr:ABC transporter ATP-binding protein [Gammaproteobacteria bacterium]
MSLSECVKIESLSKHFAETVAVSDVSLSVGRGEIFCLLGGSGCGKTTLLRMLAGFERPTAGRILIDGMDMADVPPNRRPVNLMFQSYALFPHMSVFQNVAFGLEQERVSRTEIDRRVREMLDAVKLEGLAGRKPQQLSGGQRQRVALARALVKRPKLLLLDEPLGALDKKLREHTQFELVALQRQLGITFVVVTHDQQEAMSLATRIGVMNQGRIVQVGTPDEIYESPATRFVADFIGSVNIFEGHIGNSGEGGLIAHCGALQIPLPSRVAMPDGTRLALALRPEKIRLQRQSDTGAQVGQRGTVEEVGYLGESSHYRVRLDDGTPLRVDVVNHRRDASQRIQRAERVTLTWSADDLIVLTD